jgi:hypothetical protein
MSINNNTTEIKFDQNENDQSINDYDSSISRSLFENLNLQTRIHPHNDEEQDAPFLGLEQPEIMRSIATDYQEDLNPIEMDMHSHSSSQSYHLYSLNEKLWANATNQHNDEHFGNKVSIPLSYSVVHESTADNDTTSTNLNLTKQQYLECKQYVPLSLPPPIIEPYYSFTIHSEKLLNDNTLEQLNILVTLVDALNSFMPLSSILETCDENGTCDISGSDDINTKDLTVDFDIRPTKQRFQGVVYSNACTSTAAAALFSLQVYVNNDHCIVELQRRYGDCRVFCKFFRALKALIGETYSVEAKPFPNLGTSSQSHSNNSAVGVPNGTPSLPLPQLSVRAASEVFHSLGLCQASAAATNESDHGTDGKTKRIGTLHCYVAMLSNLIPFMRSQILSKQQDAMRLLCDIFAPRTNSTKEQDSSAEDFDINLAIQAFLEYEKEFFGSENNSTTRNNNSDLAQPQKSSFSALLTLLLTSNDWELRYYTATFCYYLAQYPAMRETFMSKSSPLYAAMCQIQHHPSSSPSTPHNCGSSQSSHRPSHISSEEDDDYQFRNSRRQVARALHTCG